MTTAQEAAIIAAAVAAIRGRALPALPALLDEPVARVLGGAPASRAFTGVAFDLLCWARLRNERDAIGIAEVGRLCAASEARFGDQPWSQLYRACLALIDDDWAAAAALYRRAGADVAVLWKRSVGCRSVPAPRACDGWRAGSIAMPAAEVVRRGDAGDMVVLASCDHRYLRRYVPAWLASIARHAPGAAVHLHLVDPAADDPAWLVGIAGPLAPRLTISAERYRGGDARAWYAAARFVRLAERLETSAVPVLCADVDAVLATPLAPELQDRDAVLMSKPGYRAHPWHAIQAGAVLVAPTAGGRRFARALGAVTAGIFARQAAGLWYADQNALFAVHRLLADEVRFGAFADLDMPCGLTFGKAFGAAADSDASRSAALSVSAGA